MDPTYKVIYTESVRNTLKNLCSQAARVGLGAKVLLAILTIDNRLRRDPRGFGEPKYHYRALKLELRVGIEAPLVVHYAVHEEHPLVFVKWVHPLPRAGF